MIKLSVVGLGLGQFKRASKFISDHTHIADICVSRIIGTMQNAMRLRSSGCVYGERK